MLIPTRNEHHNVRPLLSRLAASGPLPLTVMFVDDSDDETPRTVEEAARAGFDGLTVELLHRAPSERIGGLGGAVLAGLARCHTTWVCVMDGDLQHPPERVPALHRTALDCGADLVIASRYVPGGRNEGLGPVRTVVSWASNVLARLVFPRRLQGIHDAMSGFFLFRRAALTSPMAPRGFKILLEIAVRHPDLVRRELPFVFVERTAGRSKGTLREGLRFLRLLLEMRLHPDLPAPLVGPEQPDKHVLHAIPTATPRSGRG